MDAGVHRRCRRAAIGWHLVKISASGPMPTSRYWLQAPCAISTCLSCAACGGAGLQLGQVVADQAGDLGADGARRRARSPRARSSMTRSSMEMAKVTPAAFTACRSIGREQPGLVAVARSRAGCWRGWCRADRGFRRWRRGERRPGRGSRKGRAWWGRWRRYRADPTPRRATTDGPCRSGRQTRPASVACRSPWA